jgi:hypothetical protein
MSKMKLLHKQYPQQTLPPILTRSTVATQTVVATAAVEVAISHRSSWVMWQTTSIVRRATKVTKQAAE